MEIEKDWKQSEHALHQLGGVASAVRMRTSISPGQVSGNHGQEVESVVVEIMSGQGNDGVEIYWEVEKDFWSVLKQTVSKGDVLLPPKWEGWGLR